MRLTDFEATGYYGIFLFMLVVSRVSTFLSSLPSCLLLVGFQVVSLLLVDLLFIGLLLYGLLVLSLYLDLVDFLLGDLFD